jgi:hypothetical protein
MGVGDAVNGRRDHIGTLKWWERRDRHSPGETAETWRVHVMHSISSQIWDCGRSHRLDSPSEGHASICYSAGASCRLPTQCLSGSDTRGYHQGIEGPFWRSSAGDRSQFKVRTQLSGKSLQEFTRAVELTHWTPSFGRYIIMVQSQDPAEWQVTTGTHKGRRVDPLDSFFQMVHHHGLWQVPQESF